jgi:hypothetical protein
MTCECTGPGFCPVYQRDMTQEDWDVCRAGVDWLKARKIHEWSQQTGRTGGCVYNAGPWLDEHGIQRVKRGCGCGGRRAIEPMLKCLHPLHSDPMPDDCETRCIHFTAK